MIAAAKDATAGDVGFVMQDLVVPDFHGDALQVSSVTLAKKVDRAATPSTDGSERFVMGNYRVLPSPRGEFKGGEDLWLYYQIYNTANDPVSGRPKLKVSYRFEKVEKTGNRIIGGKPIEQTVNSNVQIYAVPIGAVWPAGAYQVTVKIDDLTSGTSVSSIVPFTVVK